MEALIAVTLMLIVVAVTVNWPSVKELGRAAGKTIAGIFSALPAIKSVPILDADIIEGTSTIQSCCPTCEYGRGRLDSFIASFPKEEIVTCETCNTTYRALVL